MTLTTDKASGGVRRLALMAFFPSDPEVRAGLVAILLEMIETDEQLDWLVSRALRLYTRWPGVAEIRALYCSRYKPKDGVEGYSETYSDGYPSERPAGPAPSPLPPGREVTADSFFDKELIAAAKLKKFPGAAAAPDRKKR